MAASLQDSFLRAGRSGQRLAVVPRPGFAGLYATVRALMEGSADAGGRAIKRSAFGWIIPAREPQCRRDRLCPESAYINIIPSGLN